VRVRREHVAAASFRRLVAALAVQPGGRGEARPVGLAADERLEQGLRFRFTPEPEQRAPELELGCFERRIEIDGATERLDRVLEAAEREHDLPELLVRLGVRRLGLDDRLEHNPRFVGASLAQQRGAEQRLKIDLARVSLERRAADALRHRCVARAQEPDGAVEATPRLLELAQGASPAAWRRWNSAFAAIIADTSSRSASDR